MPVGRHRRRRPRALITAAVIVVALAAVAGGVDVGYAAVKSHADQLQAALTKNLQAGQQELEAGKTSLSQANAKHDAGLVPQANAHFTAARSQFLAAGRLADSSQLLRNLELVPSVGDSVRSKHVAVSAISTMGVALSDAGLDLAVLAGELIKPSAAGPSGKTLLTVLNNTRLSLTKVRGDLDRAQTAAALVDVRVVPSGQQAAFLKARATIDTAIAGLDEFDRLAPILVEILGGNGARTYLVEQVNPAELRAGGGFIGSYSLLRADHGTLSVIRSGDAADDLADPRPQRGQPGFVPEPGPLREVIPNESWSFLDSNLSPDFPSNARAAERWVQPRLKMAIDGVISIDYYAVAKMLELTGPLAVPGYKTITATNFIPLIIQPDIAGSRGHKAILAAVAGPLMARVAAIPPERWPTLLGAFNDLAAAHHLQSYFNNASVQSEINRVGWSAVMNPRGYSDFLMEVESNYTGNKANYFISRHYTIALTRAGNVLHHRITVDLVNRESYAAEDRTYYHVNIRLYVGLGASSTASNLLPVKVADPPTTGVRLVEGWLPIVNCCGGKGRAVFTYDTPWPANADTNQIYWQKQPGTVVDTATILWTAADGHSYQVSGNLAQDRLIEMSSLGVSLTAGQAGLAVLPSLSLG